MKKRDLIAYLLVFLQFAGIGILFITGPVIPDETGWIIMEMAGLFLGCWSVYIMRYSNLSALPIVKNDARLVIRGPYRLIRHPMYTSVLLVCGALIANSFSLFRGVVFLALLITLIIKLFFEERLLKEHFHEYKYYIKNTKRIVPWIF